MTWRRFHLLLCVIVAVIAAIRIITGNYLGAVIPIILAVIFGSIAADFPLLSRARRIWRLLRRTLFG